MEIDARAVAQEGWDMRIDLVRATGMTNAQPIPESQPLSLLVLAIALGIGASYQRQPKK